MDKQFKITEVRPYAGVEYKSDGKFDSVPMTRVLTVEYFKTNDEEYITVILNQIHENGTDTEVVSDLFRLERRTKLSYKFDHINPEYLDIDLDNFKEFETTIKHTSVNQKGGVYLELGYNETHDRDDLAVISYGSTSYGDPKQIVIPLPSKGNN